MQQAILLTDIFGKMRCMGTQFDNAPLDVILMKVERSPPSLNACGRTDLVLTRFWSIDPTTERDSYSGSVRAGQALPQGRDRVQL